MLITRVELQNTKSYLEDAVTFAEGTNAICGENGAGKSTLLEAIGFALFDYLPYKQDDFVREGEKTATITVSFISNQDGREYQVVRRCGGSSDYYVYDPEIGARVVSSKADVSDWLKDHLGVEPTADLTALFRDAVGVPQGLLTAAFLQTPAQRKPIFDKLLQVDEYEQVWKTLRDTSGYLKDKIAESDKAIAGLAAEVKRLPDQRRRVGSLQADITQIDARLAALGTDLAAAVAQRDALEAVQKELDDLNRQAERLAERLQGIDEQLATAEKAVTEAEAARAAVEASRAGHQAYEAAQDELAALEEDRKHRDDLRGEQAEQRTSLAQAQERLKRLEADLAEVEQAQASMAALQPQVERQAQAEAALKTAQEQVHALELAQAQADGRRPQLDDLWSRLETVEAGLVEAGRLETELGQARQEGEEKRQALTDLTAGQAALKAERDRLAEQTGTLETTEAATCPVCEQPLTAEHRADLLARNRERLGELKAQIKGLSDEIRAAQEANRALEEQVTGMEADLRDLPRPADRSDLAGQAAELERALAGAQARIEELAGSPDEAARLAGELAELADPRRRYDSLSGKAQHRTALEAQWESENHAAGALAASLDEIERALVPFADLDTRLDAGRAALRQHEADHRRHLENAQVAADLDARRGRVENLQDQLAALSAERDAAQARAAQVAAGFDPAALAAARRRADDLQTERARQEGALDRLRQELADTEREVEALEASAQTLVAEQSALAGRQALLAVTEFIRGVVKQAGPYVTRRLVQQVSLEAARLYAEVMADYTGRLGWNEEYEITLEKDGRERGFQQLSGGEQMAAALAVRLALLRELSSIDVAFFDEPTSNLDMTRRDSLADQILAVKGFSQLFVISHDDTFERVTNNVVRVTKENGVSKIESGG
jgi:exonuclease SbcC